MSEQPEQHQDELSEEELEEQNGEALPDREVMTTIQPPGGSHPAMEPGPPPSE